MAKTVLARLDDETQNQLEQLSRRLGWSESRIVREGIAQLLRAKILPAKKRIAGLGKFKSGVSDLGSSKDHLRGFGK